ncbi:MAG TPA: PadR family transcriptional regulator [Candidatus Binataceae bacterium]
MSEKARKPRVKSALEHALLGLVAEVPGITGYDIVKIFNLSMAHYWHAHQGQIYPTLERMVGRGWLRGRDVVQRGRPNKRLYTITTGGQRMLVEWLESPFEELKLKFPALLRCRFLGHLGADGAREKIREQREAWEKHLATYRAIEQEHFAEPRRYPNVNAMFSYFTLRGGIDWMEENIRWCDWAVAEIDRNRRLFASKQQQRSPATASAGVAPDGGMRKTARRRAAR